MTRSKEEMETVRKRWKEEQESKKATAGKKLGKGAYAEVLMRRGVTKFVQQERIISPFEK